MNGTIDVAVIGAGPAGMEAAATAAAAGLETMLFDEQPAPGGQIFRAIEQLAGRGEAFRRILGEEYARGEELVLRFRQGRAVYRPGTSVP
ncbi:MAG: FAD-dependent oxidoreductase [Geminicoccaceae bacterium]